MLEQSGRDGGVGGCGSECVGCCGMEVQVLWGHGGCFPSGGRSGMCCCCIQTLSECWGPALVEGVVGQCLQLHRASLTHAPLPGAGCN